MTEESPPPPPSNENPGPESTLLGTGDLDINQATTHFLHFLKSPPGLWGCIQSVLKDPKEFFSGSEGEDLNRALGFLGSMLVYGLGFSLLGMLLTVNVWGFFLIIPGFLIFSLIGLALASILVWILGKPVSGGDGTFADAARVVSYLSWIGLINAFPLFVFLPDLLQALISLGCLALWAYLAVPAITTVFKTPRDTHRIPVWAAAGIFGLFILIGSLVGTGAKVVADSYEDLIVETEEKVRELEAAHLAQLAEERALAEAEAAAAAAAAKEAVSPATVEIPETRVRELLRELRELGAVEVPRELKQAFRKYNGHLEGADFSGIEVIGLDLRMLDLTGASFRNATMTDWTFHGIGNTPSSVLDGADFSGATIENVNMTGVSAKGADFSGATLVGTGRARTVLDLENADIEGADLSGMSFRGNVNAKAIYLGRANLEGASLRKANLPNTDFTKARLRGADLTAANLRGAILNGADIREAIFAESDLSGMQISEQIKLDNQFIPFDSPMPMTEGADFSGARLDGVNFQHRIFRFCDFSGASLVNANLEAGNFVGSRFNRADLTGANLKRANFAAADFSGATLANNDWENAHLAGAEIRKNDSESARVLPPFPEGSEVPRLRSGRASDKIAAMVDGSGSNQVGADLRGLSFARQRLTRIDFSGANLEGADFNYAELGRCNFSRANLEQASFAFARINQCTFDEANLRGANFYGAVFSQNSFVAALLREADFRYTGRAEYSTSDKLDFERADLGKADFRRARLSYLSAYGLATRRENTLPMGTGLGASSSYVNFDKADLSGADLSEAWLIEASLAGARLNGMKARGSDLSGFYSNWDTIWEGADLQGSNLAFGQIWHKDTERVKDGRTDFAKADLRGANLFRFAFTPGTHVGAADFSNCVFGVDPWGKITDVKNGPAGTDLAMVSFEGAKFTGADLRRCGFSNANISGADFGKADLSGAHFSVGNGVQAGGNLETNLKDWQLRYRGVNFTGARLDGADFASGDFAESIFANVSHVGTKVHRDPSRTAPAGMSYMNFAYNVPGFIGSP